MNTAEDRDGPINVVQDGRGPERRVIGADIKLHASYNFQSEAISVDFEPRQRKGCSNYETARMEEGIDLLVFIDSMPSVPLLAQG